MKFIEFIARIKKIIKMKIIQRQNQENHKIHRIPRQNIENHEYLIISSQNHENIENFKIP